MNREEFIKLIQSIGFKKSDNIINTYYTYKEFVIDLFHDFYEFHNGSHWVEDISYTDLKQLEKHFKNYFRSIKLKELLA
jgi:hypothetical protein